MIDLIPPEHWRPVEILDTDDDTPEYGDSREGAILMTVELRRPLLSFSAELCNEGIVIYHPDGEIRIMGCPLCKEDLGKVQRWSGFSPDGPPQNKLICTSCRKDITWELSKIIVDLMYSMTHRDEKSSFTEWEAAV